LPQNTNDILLVSALVLTFVLSYLSYRFIETPIRLKDFRSNPKKLFIPIFAVMILIASVGYFLEYNDGLPNRFPGIQKIMKAPTDMNRQNPMGLRPDQITWEKYPTLGDEKASHYTFVVMGDSHADAIAPGFDLIAKKLHIKGKLLSEPGNPAIFGVNWGPYEVFSQVKAKWLDLIKQHPHIKEVFLVSRWAIYANGYGCKNEEFLEEKDVVLWDKYSKSHTNISQNAEVLQRGLIRTLKIFKDLHIKVIIVEDVPEIGWNVPETLFKLYILRGVKAQKIEPPTYAEYLERQKPVIEVFDRAKKLYNFSLINPAKVLCEDNKPCKVMDNEGYPLYRDSDHLTNHGAYYVVKHDKNFEKELDNTVISQK